MMNMGGRQLALGILKVVVMQKQLGLVKMQSHKFMMHVINSLYDSIDHDRMRNLA